MLLWFESNAFVYRNVNKMSSPLVEPTSDLLVNEDPEKIELQTVETEIVDGEKLTDIADVEIITTVAESITCSPIDELSNNLQKTTIDATENESKLSKTKPESNEAVGETVEESEKVTKKKPFKKYYKKKFGKNKNTTRVSSDASTTSQMSTASNAKEETEKENKDSILTVQKETNEKSLPKKKFQKKRFNAKKNIDFSNLNGQVVNGVLYVTNEMPIQHAPIVISRAPAPQLIVQNMPMTENVAPTTQGVPFKFRSNHVYQSNANVRPNNKGTKVRNGGKYWRQNKGVKGDENYYGSNPFPKVAIVEKQKSEKKVASEIESKEINSVRMIEENNLTSTSLNTIVDPSTN